MQSGRGAETRGSDVGRSRHVGDVGPKSGSRSSANQIWNEDGVGPTRLSSSFPLLRETDRFFFLVGFDNTNLHLCFIVPSRDCLASANKGRVYYAMVRLFC